MYKIFLSLLNQKNCTVADVAKATGINQSTLSNWKKRDNLLSGKNAALVADFFGVPVDYLMTGDPKYLYFSYVQEVEPTLSLEETKLIKAFRSADELTQQMILRLLGLEQDSDSKQSKEA